MGKFDKLSMAEQEELEQLLLDIGIQKYEGTYHGRSSIKADFAFSCPHSDYQELIMAAVRQVNYNAIDGEVDIADGFINIIDALIYCHIDQFGKEDNIYY